MINDEQGASLLRKSEQLTHKTHKPLYSHGQKALDSQKGSKETNKQQS